jgi:hypothetical protein
MRIREVLNCKDEQCRTYKLQIAAGECDYVLNNAEPNFLMRPEILLTKATVLFALKKNVEAVSTVQEAMRIRPDYVHAYLILSNHFAQRGDISNARKILERGLVYVPESEALKSKLKEFGGKKDSIDRSEIKK